MQIILRMLVVMVTVMALGAVVLAGPAAASEAQHRHFVVDLVQHKVFADFGGDLEELGEFRRIDPGALVAYVGDTVTITFINSDEYLHAFGLRDFDVRTANLAEEESEAVTFTVDEPGIFVYGCRLRYDVDQNHCTPDHRTQRGYLIVLER